MHHVSGLSWAAPQCLAAGGVPAPSAPFAPGRVCRAPGDRVCSSCLVHACSSFPSARPLLEALHWLAFQCHCPLPQHYATGRTYPATSVNSAQVGLCSCLASSAGAHTSVFIMPRSTRVFTMLRQSTHHASPLPLLTGDVAASIRSWYLTTSPVPCPSG